MTKRLLPGIRVLVILLAATSAAAWTEESPEVGGIAAAADPPVTTEKHGLGPELEILGAVSSMHDDDLDAVYGLLGGGGLGFSFRSGRDTRLVVRLQYLRSEGDPYYDVPAFDAGTPAVLHAVPFTFGFRHDLAPRAALRFHLNGNLGFEWIREELPDPADPLSSQAFDGVGVVMDVSVGPEFRTRDERRGLGLELGYGLHQADLAGSGVDNHDLNRTGAFGRAYLVLALGGGDAREVAP